MSSADDSPPYVPECGEAIWIQFTPQAEHEQAGRRPALVLSPSSYNAKVGLAILCPITSQKKGYPFEVDLPEDLAVSGVILSDQVKNLDWRVRGATPLCRVPQAVVTEVLQKLNTLLKIPR